MVYIDQVVQNITSMFRCKVRVTNLKGHLMSMSIEGLRVEDKLIVQADLKSFGTVHISGDFIYCKFSPVVLSQSLVERLTREELFLIPSAVRLENKEAYDKLLTKIKSHEGFFSHAVIENQNIIIL